MKTLALLCAFFAVVTSAAVAADDGNLHAFFGTWQSTGSVTMQGRSTSMNGSNVCRWSSGARAFLVCDGQARLGNRRTVDHQLSVYSYDAATKQYNFATITSAYTSSPDLTRSGSTWTYSGKFREASGRITYFRTLNIFESRDRYRYLIESSADNVHWTKTGSGIATRTSP